MRQPLRFIPHKPRANARNRERAAKAYALSSLPILKSTAAKLREEAEVLRIQAFIAKQCGDQSGAQEYLDTAEAKEAEANKLDQPETMQ